MGVLEDGMEVWFRHRARGRRFGRMGREENIVQGRKACKQGRDIIVNGLEMKELIRRLISDVRSPKGR